MRRTVRGLIANARGNRGGWLALAAVLAAALLSTGGFASDAFAARGLITGLDDNKYGSADAAIRDPAFQRTVEAGAGLARFNVTWRSVAKAQPLDPANPTDPAYDFSAVDRAVSGAAAHGLDVLLTVYEAPAYAEGPNPPAGVGPGTWKPDPTAFAAFGRALALRYSGNFLGLPRVRYFEAWNEPNLPNFITPQWEGNHATSPGIYRDLVNSFYSAVKGVDPSNQVLAGALAPYGDPPSQHNRIRPLRFAREFLCLNSKLRKSTCPVKPSFDILSHHPIDLSGGPRTSAISPDDISTPDLGRLREALFAAERARTIAGSAKRHPIWVTELWWETDPPDPNPRVFASPREQALYLEEALYLLWKEKAKVVINLLVYDAHDLDSLQSGLFFEDGRPKPSFQSFRFPFVTERRSKDQLFAWGKSRTAGKLKIQKKAKGHWRTVGKENVRRGEVFTDRLEVRGKAKLRATVGGEKSLVWTQRR